MLRSANSGPLRGRVALVTGAGSGIGRASALALAAAGADVAALDIDQDAAIDTAARVVALGRRSIGVFVDVSSEPSVQEALTRTVGALGRLDCAHNNAGISGTFAPLADYPTDVWHSVLDIDLTGVFLCMKYELRLFAEQGSGSIVNTSSAGGAIGMPYGSGYVAAKHGVVGLTKTAAIEYAGYGIRINALLPGMTRSPMTDCMTDDLREHFIDRHPVGRCAEPEEIAAAVVWLCSSESTFVTGAELAVDGGLLAGAGAPRISLSSHGPQLLS
jgi:NAD(P)-dependent dehydrogenase (short-subunit alcohol dehydrogenase family)